MKLIVGLGNPEGKYSGTRHNLGFVVVDELAKKIDGGRMEDKSWKLEKKFKAEILRIHYELLLVRPVTYMNMSGLAVSKIASFYNRFVKTPYSQYGDVDEVDFKLPLLMDSEALESLKKKTPGFQPGEAYKISPEDIIIIHDELDLPLGQIKIRLGGAAAGHHGVESVIQYLGTDKFIRVRCGIGVQHFNAEHFVLETFMPGEKQDVRRMVKKAVEAIQLLLDKGLTIAQSQYN